MVLSVLRPPVPSEGRETSFVDIVAVHGLDEDQIEAWTHSETGCLWLRDLLPLSDLPARVLTFGYKSDATSFFGSGSSDRILHHAHTLVAELEAHRALDGGPERPIIFICHGLGGILVKKALAYSATRTSKKVEHLYSIFISTYGILFMGTPHHGIEKTIWPLMAKDVSGVLDAPSEFLTAINKNSETLQNVADQFAPLTKQFHIYFFWEGLETSMGSTQSYVVGEDSAAPIWDNTERSGIYATHSQMCKFQDLDSPGYRTVLASLLRYAREAHTTIDLRWKEAKKFLAMQRSNEVAELMAFDVRNDNKPFRLQSEDAGKMRNKYFRIPHKVSSIFTGRDDIAQGLQKKILAPSEQSLKPQQKRFVLYGLGGSGKTQFCLKFAQDNRDRFWGIFWIDASSARNAERAFSEIGRLGGMEEKFESGMYWLAGLEMPWLLVIDNADDLEIDYSSYFPSGERGHILVTSRNPESRMHATIGYQEFKEMQQEDAITLLLKAADVKNLSDEKARDLARPIARTLGYLPLALIQAGAFIRQNICSLEEYLEVYSSHKREIMSNKLGQGAEDYKYTIYTTWEVSFQMIESQATEAAADAIEILQILAFLHFDQVSATIFERAWNNLHRVESLESSKSFVEKIFKTFPFASLFVRIYERMFPSSRSRLPRILLQEGSRWDNVRFRRALFTLSSFSLIFKDIAKDSYSMHPMVHFWARDRLREKDQKIWSDIATNTISNSINGQSGIPNIIYRRSLIPHIDSCLQGEHSEPLLGRRDDSHRLLQAIKFAAVYSEGGRWREARELQDQVMSVRTRILGPEHPDTLQAMADLAWSYWNLSRMDRALELQCAVTDISLRTLGPQDPMTLRAMDSLARTYWLCGQTAKAEELGKQAVDGMRQILGPGHPHTMSAMHNLGRAYMHGGRTNDAQKLQMEVWKVRVKMLGSEHLDTLETMADLGMSCLALGQINEAEKLVANVLEARTRILGQEHAYTLWSINDLSKIYCEQGYPKEAEELLVKTQDVAIRTLGKDHIGTFMTMFNLAHAYYCQQRWSDAEGLLNGLIEIETRKLCPNHPDILIAKAELARTYKQQGHLDKAENLFLKVTEAMAKKMGPEHPRTLSAKGQLTAIYKACGQLEEVEKLEAEGLKASVMSSEVTQEPASKRQPHRASTV